MVFTGLPATRACGRKKRDASDVGRRTNGEQEEVRTERDQLTPKKKKRLSLSLSLSFFPSRGLPLVNRSCAKCSLGRNKPWSLTSSARGRTAGLGAGAALLSGRFLRGMGAAEEDAAAAPGLLELELLSAILCKGECVVTPDCARRCSPVLGGSGRRRRVKEGVGGAGRSLTLGCLIDAGRG